MIKSMTGFGRAQAKFRGGKITAEIKTVNHKFFDLSAKLPENMAPLEEKVKDLIQKRVKRGKIILNLFYDGSAWKDETININKALARRYHAAMWELKKHLGMKDDIKMAEIMAMPGVINYNTSENDYARVWPSVKRAVDGALRALMADREKEGRSLYHDLQKRVGNIKKMVSVIKNSTHLNIEEYRKKFADKIKDLTNGREIDMGRLEVEVAIYAKNSDISEEITRLGSHLVNFEKTIMTDGEAGKKLDFIAQELHREINTVGSKASDYRISKNVIEVKSEIEKIREQVKNLE